MSRRLAAILGFVCLGAAATMCLCLMVFAFVARESATPPQTPRPTVQPRVSTATPATVATIAATEEATSVPGRPVSREQVVEARRMFVVQVVSFDASQEFGAEFPYSDYVRVKITNGSNIVLPYLTVLTKRFDSTGRMIGSSRAPSISVADLKPGQSAEVDYYPRGHLPGVDKITLEIESLISPENERFFPELSR